MLADPKAETRLASPCVGVCRLDERTGWCLGCGRSAVELAAWRDLDEEARERLWRQLPGRRQRLGLRFGLLPWTPRALLARLAELSEQPGAAWSIGVHGAVAELMAAPGQAVEAVLDAEALTLRTAGGRLRIAIHPGLRAFSLMDGGGRIARIVLALHRSRLPAPSHGVADLGPDGHAIEPAARNHRLFDLGLGLAPVRFCVRTGDEAVATALRRRAGRSVLEPGSPLMPVLLAASPDRILASPLGRMEVEGPILHHGHEGPHSHLLPDLLAQNRELEPGFELPEAYAPCATFHPPDIEAVVNPATGH
ncbi:MAG TPA: DUF1289 domain-containing protein [Geminicoccaceae bacterium]|nr:DUF1289 domain-containing protein [Geminicoccus sp.]HMU51052.1 DUF1289 domain-containing protein [Geminicoccaceae bacterium]